MKKIIFCAGSFIVIAISIVNVTITNKDLDNSLSLSFLGSLALAQDEESVTSCNGLACDDANGYHYKSAFISETGQKICCGISSESDRGCKQS